MRRPPTSECSLCEAHLAGGVFLPYNYLDWALGKSASVTYVR